MNPFAYVSPALPEAAVELVRDGGRYLAGGIDLLGEMKESLAAPATLVNVKGLPDTRGVAFAQGACSIGANVTVAELAANAEVARVFPGLASAAASVGSPQIRNRATVGGNLAQHSRCWCYRHRDIHCRKKGGTLCFARLGANKYHSLFTGCLCVSPAVSTLAVALAVLDARIEVLRGRRKERLSVAELYEHAWHNPAVHNSLGPADLILGVSIPAASGLRSVYLETAEKGDFDWALVSCAASASVVSGSLRNARIALGSVAPVPWQVEEANRYLEGRGIDGETAGRAADLILQGATPLPQNGYKLPIARTLIRRALAALAA